MSGRSDWIMPFDIRTKEQNKRSGFDAGKLEVPLMYLKDNGAKCQRVCHGVEKSLKKKEVEAVHLKSLAFLEKLVPDRKGQIELPI